jgi:hypothetical protein
MSDPDQYDVTFSSAARRGFASSRSPPRPLFEQYRALHTVDEHERIVTVVAIAHRRDAYCPR